MERSTQHCTRFNHPEFVLQCAEEMAFDLPWLVGVLEKAVASGTVFRPGETFQLGWSSLLIRNAAEGRLSLWELDLSGEPGRLENSVTRSLLALRRQKSVLESFGVADRLEFASMRQRAVMCARFAVSPSRMMTRSKPTPEDSGWFFGCRDADHDHQRPENLRGGSLYELVCANLLVLDFLAMPADSLLLLDDKGRVKQAFDPTGEELRIRPGSYLEMKQQSLGGD